MVLLPLLKSREIKKLSDMDGINAHAFHTPIADYDFVICVDAC
jgi:hypothetical protein